MSTMSDKFTVVKYTFEGEKFEILVKPDPALDYKLGKIKDISSVLVSDEIYQNSSKGTRAPSEKLQKAFKTDDALIIAEKILQKGDLNLTTEQRRKMTTEKRKQISHLLQKHLLTLGLIYLTHLLESNKLLLMLV